MDELFALLIPLGCGCVLPILVIWLTIRKEMNETSEDTVKKQLSRGRDKLKEILKI